MLVTSPYSFLLHSKCNPCSMVRHNQDGCRDPRQIERLCIHRSPPHLLQDHVSWSKLHKTMCTASEVPEAPAQVLAQIDEPILAIELPKPDQEPATQTQQIHSTSPKASVVKAISITAAAVACISLLRYGFSATQAAQVTTKEVALSIEGVPKSLRKYDNLNIQGEECLSSSCDEEEDDEKLVQPMEQWQDCLWDNDEKIGTLLKTVEDDIEELKKNEQQREKQWEQDAAALREKLA